MLKVPVRCLSHCGSWQTGRGLRSGTKGDDHQNSGSEYQLASYPTWKEIRLTMIEFLICGFGMASHLFLLWNRRLDRKRQSHQFSICRWLFQQYRMLVTIPLFLICNLFALKPSTKFSNTQKIWVLEASVLRKLNNHVHIKTSGKASGS